MFAQMTGDLGPDRTRSLKKLHKWDPHFKNSNLQSEKEKHSNDACTNQNPTALKLVNQTVQNVEHYYYY